MAHLPRDQHGLVWDPITRDDVGDLSRLLTAIEHLDATVVREATPATVPKRDVRDSQKRCGMRR